MNNLEYHCNPSFPFAEESEKGTGSGISVLASCSSQEDILGVELLDTRVCAVVVLD